MGISIDDIPAIGTLPALERRALARHLRTLLPRGASRSAADLQAELGESPFAGHTSVEDLCTVGWLESTGTGYHADTYARRIAAGAVDGSRMTLEEALALAQAVQGRIAQVHGVCGGVRLARVVLYGSAVRSEGNVKPDIGDLDIAFELSVEDPEVWAALQALPADQQWREAMRRSGWETQLMQGDDRITLAGSLTRVLALFWRQCHGEDLLADGRRPAVVQLWPKPPQDHPDDALPALTPLPAWADIEALPALLAPVLTYLLGQTQATQARGRAFHHELSAP